MREKTGVGMLRSRRYCRDVGRPKGGKHTDRTSKPVAVRVPNELLELVHLQCGGQKGLAEWLRNTIRTSCSIPLNKEVGYQEGFMAGWADANKKFRAGLRQAG